MSQTNRDLPPEAYDTFVRLFAQHGQRVFAYILALLPNRTDAQEVFQETSVVLWREFANFRPDGDFGRWGCGIALNQVRKFRRQRQRDKLVFNDVLIEQLAEERLSGSDRLQQRQAALAECLKKLRAKDRDLIGRCYAGTNSYKAVAEQTGRPVNTVYKALTRIRRALMECIDRRLLQEGEA